MCGSCSILAQLFCIYVNVYWTIININAGHLFSIGFINFCRFSMWSQALSTASGVFWWIHHFFFVSLYLVFQISRDLSSFLILIDVYYTSTDFFSAFRFRNFLHFFMNISTVVVRPKQSLMFSLFLGSPYSRGLVHLKNFCGIIKYTNCYIILLNTIPSFSLGKIHWFAIEST